MTSQDKRQVLARLLQQKSRPAGIFPLSPAQQRLWFLEQLTPAQAIYNLPALIRLEGSLNVPALKAGLTIIQNRHQALRTTFTAIDGRPVQQVIPAALVSLTVSDLVQLPASQRAAEVARQTNLAANRPFDLAQGPLWRSHLLKLSPTEHLLLVTMHHIISDGWSMRLFIRELSACYTACATGSALTLPALPIQYVDYAGQQRQRLRAGELNDQLAYWRQQLGGSLPVLRLPTDFPRPAQQRFRGASQACHLPKALSQALRQLGQQAGCTLYMVLLAAYAVLLHRYSGQDEIVIGSPVANRRRTDIENLIGFFVNTLVLRHDLSGAPGFLEFLQRVRRVAVQAYAHSDVPFENLVKELQPGRDLSHTPLFQTAFAFQNDPWQQTLTWPGVTAHCDLNPESGTSKFDLTLALRDAAEGLVGAVEYSTDLFEADTIRRFVSHYQTLLESIVAHPNQSISKLSMLTEAERTRLLETGPVPVPSSRQRRCLHQLFEAQAGQRPEAPALVYQQRQMTYGSLNKRANYLAHRLIAQGVRPGQLVGVCVEPSPDLIIAILGILKAGAAYLPLDPAVPPVRLASILDDAQVALLLTQQRLQDTVAVFQGTTFFLDDQPQTDSAPRDSQNPATAVTSNDPAYVIYTSGSTGQPKGVVVPHKNVVRLFEATEAWYRFDSQDVWTLFHSCAFDFSVWEMWGALLYGGRLVVVPLWVRRSPEVFYRLILDEQVTVLNQTPSAFGQLIRAEAALERQPELTLRYVILGGEALDMRLLGPWFERHGDEQPQLVNMYGITETTVHVTYRPVTRDDLTKSSVIGRPLPDLYVYLLDEQRQPVPVGVPGEIYVGGAGVAAGYLNRPALTAERFIPDPFQDKPGQRLYRSGDLGRYLGSGELEYVGRIDDQVKIRGHRIEPGEIEANLNHHPTVQKAIVVTRTNEAAEDTRLVAYIVPNKGQKAPAAALRQYLAQRLPEYMVPAAYVTIEAIPLTNNGKLDRQALPQPIAANFDLEKDIVPPRTAVEQVLAKIWTTLLSQEQIGIYDNFFEAGGHSLLATRVISQIRTVFEIDLPLRTLFEQPTIAGLGQLIDEILEQEIAGLSEAEAEQLINSYG